ncbi:MAG: peptidase, partial [Albidovulum sp.]|nr:peptidase [Albidovulum sp.]
MTYCVGLTLDEGLVYIADTRTNAGVDDISTFRKLHAVDTPGERSMTLLSS